MTSPKASQSGFSHTNTESMTMREICRKSGDNRSAGRWGHVLRQRQGLGPQAISVGGPKPATSGLLFARREPCSQLILHAAMRMRRPYTVGLLSRDFRSESS